MTYILIYAALLFCAYINKNNKEILLCKNINIYINSFKENAVKGR